MTLFVKLFGGEIIMVMHIRNQSVNQVGLFLFGIRMYSQLLAVGT